MSGSGIETVAVFGAGFMGGGIAQVAAMGGKKVLLTDSKPGKANKAKEKIGWSLDKLISKGKFSGKAAKVLGRIEVLDDIAQASGADMLIEAVYENVAVKQELLAKLDAVAKKDAVIASNTSSIPISLMAPKVSNPSRFIGTHFFGPVPLMGLLEIVMGPDTSEATLEKVKLFATEVGKTAIVVRKPSPGFLVNRIFNAAAGEAIRCWLEGVATPQDIDTGMRLGYNWGAGPFEVFDASGLNIMAGIFSVIGGSLPPQLKEMLDKGHLGKKTGQGFYKYGPDGKKIVG